MSSMSKGFCTMAERYSLPVPRTHHSTHGHHQASLVTLSWHSDHFITQNYQLSIVFSVQASPITFKHTHLVLLPKRFSLEWFSPKNPSKNQMLEQQTVVARLTHSHTTTLNFSEETSFNKSCWRNVDEGFPLTFAWFRRNRRAIFCHHFHSLLFFFLPSLYSLPRVCSRMATHTVPQKG